MTPKNKLKSLFKQEKIFKQMLFAAIFTVGSFMSSYGQTIKGVVTSESGSLPTANIIGKTFNNSAISDLEGAFTLTANAEGEATIEISYIGFETKSITLNLVKGINDLGIIQLTPDGKRRVTSQEWYGSRGQAGLRYDIF